MSLDVYLREQTPTHSCTCMYCGNEHTCRKQFYNGNITHNLSGMANALGIYMQLWRPEEVGITRASQLIIPLTNGLKLLVDQPELMKYHNPQNGWGDYDGFIEFVREYLDACLENPEAVVEVSR